MEFSLSRFRFVQRTALERKRQVSFARFRRTKFEPERVRVDRKTKRHTHTRARLNHPYTVAAWGEE